MVQIAAALTDIVGFEYMCLALWVIRAVCRLVCAVPALLSETRYSAGCTRSAGSYFTSCSYFGLARPWCAAKACGPAIWLHSSAESVRVSEGVRW